MIELPVYAREKLFFRDLVYRGVSRTARANAFPKSFMRRLRCDGVPRVGSSETPTARLGWNGSASLLISQIGCRAGLR